MNKIAIQGIRGAFHEEAARLFYGNDCDIEPCLTFIELTEKVIHGQVSSGIMAIENSISGTILSNLELIRKYSLQICAEVNIRIVQNLAGVTGSDLSTIKEVHSHYMALNQCRDYFTKYPNIRLVESADTALSLRDVAEWNNKSIAAIGSKLAVEQYHLTMLAEGIETNPLNYTRFVIVNTESIPSADSNKVSISIILPHKPGSLARVLSLLNIMEINLTKLESVPVIGKPWNYRFYIDFIMPAPNLFDHIIELLTKIADEITIMGKYKTIKTEKND